MDLATFSYALPLLGWAVHSGFLTRRLATARRDPLTGLLTRDGWSRTAEKTLRRHRDAVVLLIDLDDFKNLNDTHGHAAGDAALTTVAERLTNWAGNAGIVGRLGGDEFVTVLDHLDATSGLDTLATALCQPMPYHGRPVPLSASVGCCHVADLHLPCLPDALAAADAAMYRRKGHARR